MYIYICMYDRFDQMYMYDMVDFVRMKTMMTTMHT